MEFTGFYRIQKAGGLDHITLPELINPAKGEEDWSARRHPLSNRRTGAPVLPVVFLRLAAARSAGGRSPG